MDFVPDKRIGNYCFSFKGEIGKGSFSLVYLGKDARNNFPVAIKVIDKRSIIHEYYASLLSNEITVMKQLDHPNIVKLFEVLHTPNNFYIITEYCKGGDLSKVIQKKGKLPEHEALKIFRDIIKGFQALVACNIIHRDIKPHNIYINDGVFKIGDFGFAKLVLNQLEEIRTPLIGTPLYMPPQVLQELPYTAKCDVWSMGVILHEMIFGKVPWNANTHIELLNKYYNEPFHMTESTGISPFVVEFLNKSLQIEEYRRISWNDLFNHQIFKSEIVPKETEELVKTQQENKEEQITVEIDFSNNLPFSVKIFEFLSQMNFKFSQIFSIPNLSSVIIKKIMFLTSKIRVCLCKQFEKKKNSLNLGLLAKVAFTNETIETLANEVYSDFNSLFEELSKDEDFHSEVAIEEKLSLLFNNNFNEEKSMYEVLIENLKLEIRELNHEIFTSNSENNFSMISALAASLDYLEFCKIKLTNYSDNSLVEKIWEKKESFLSQVEENTDETYSRIRKKIYEENI